MTTKLTRPCVICGKLVTRYAGQFGKTTTCSKTCMATHYRTRCGDKSAAWRGGQGTMNALGYLVRKRNGRTVAIHREVMEQHLGRSLMKDEVVHHINGNRTDNRIENLVLCRNQVEHISTHHKKGSTRTICRICGAPEWSNRLCATHHSRQRRGIPLDRPIQKRRSKKTCAFCLNPPVIRGLCNRCHQIAVSNGLM